MANLILKLVFISSLGGMVFMMVRKIPDLAKLPPSKKKPLFITRLWRAFLHLQSDERLSSGYWKKVKGE